MDFTSKNNLKKKIIIVDFGSQVTKLIARRIRELGVFSEIYNINQINSEKNFDNIGGIILSGGPSTVTKKNFPKVSKKIFEKKIPILGICYGLQLIAKTFGGKVNSIQKKREFGGALLKKIKSSVLTKNFFKNGISKVWMSHQDAVIKLPKNFIKIASTNNSALSVIENRENKIYGIQFHPEVTHTNRGKIIFRNFIYNVCKVKKKLEGWFRKEKNNK